MVETQSQYINLLINTEFQKKHANNMLLQIQLLSVALLFKIVKIVILLDAGLSQLTTNGSFHNMVQYQELLK